MVDKKNIGKVLIDFVKKVKEKDVMFFFLFGYGNIYGIGENLEFYYLMKNL